MSSRLKLLKKSRNRLRFLLPVLFAVILAGLGFPGQAYGPLTVKKTAAEALTLDEDMTFEAYDGKLVTFLADGVTITCEYKDGTTVTVEEDGTYTGKDEVALYLYGFEELPSNFISKNEAKDLGWISSKGNLQDVAPGMSIGGDRFGNYEGLLPKEKNRQYYECDINYEGGRRGAERIIFSNDGLVYYTNDHYKTFEQLY